MLTDNQLARLTAYEQYFATALRSNYPRSPGPRALREIHAVLREVDPTTPVLNTTCGTCILRVLKKAGRLYFDRKEADEKEQAEAVAATEEAAQAPEQVGTKSGDQVGTKPPVELKIVHVSVNKDAKKPQISAIAKQSQPERQDRKPKKGNGAKTSNKGRKSAKK